VRNPEPGQPLTRSGQHDDLVLGACQVQANDHITPEAASIVRHVGPSFVSGQTREGITRTGRRCRLPLSHTLILDNGREFCGTEASHPYELLLAMEGIEHRTTRVRTPRTNGFVERMNRTLLDECFRVAGRTTWYVSIEEIQRDLDQFLEYYNLRRSHQGYRLAGRTPAQALQEALGITELPPLVTTAEGEEVPSAA
jgi:transposase InsO family protein